MDKIYISLGYSYNTNFMSNWSTDKKMYVRINIYYKDNKIHTEDLFEADMYYTTQVFNKNCRIYERDKKLQQLGI